MCPLYFHADIEFNCGIKGNLAYNI
jgi:hypothetical protein